MSNTVYLDADPVYTALVRIPQAIISAEGYAILADAVRMTSKGALSGDDKGKVGYVRRRDANTGRMDVVLPAGLSTPVRNHILSQFQQEERQWSVRSRLRKKLDSQGVALVKPTLVS